MGIFEQNLERRKSELRQNFGGEHGMKEHILLGAHPGFQPVFFDDGVPIASDSGSNLYNALVFDGDIEASGDLKTSPDSGSMETKELFLKLSHPVDDIAFIAIALSAPITVDYSNANSISSVNITTQLQPRIGINLIKTPMELGVMPFGLDELTGTNARWHKNSATHGTLYQTASNFDSFGNKGALLWDYNTDLSLTGHSGSITISDDDVDFMEDQNPIIGPVIATSFKVPKRDGPYFGVHIFLQSRNFGGIDELFRWNGTIDWDYHTQIASPRLPITQGTHRSFVMANEVYSF